MLPNADRAVVDLAKVRDCCLCETHPTGKHKARVFLSRLGLTAADAGWLGSEILQAAQREPAQKGVKDGHGQRCVSDFDCSASVGTARGRTAWIVLSGEDAPRLTSCFVLQQAPYERERQAA